MAKLPVFDKALIMNIDRASHEAENSPSKVMVINTLVER
jgi:hypothetical protein